MNLSNQFEVMRAQMDGLKESIEPRKLHLVFGFKKQSGFQL